jgi:hypothetical protein
MSLTFIARLMVAMTPNRPPVRQAWPRRRAFVVYPAELVERSFGHDMMFGVCIIVAKERLMLALQWAVADQPGRTSVGSTAARRNYRQRGAIHVARPSSH